MSNIMEHLRSLFTKLVSGKGTQLTQEDIRSLIRTCYDDKFNGTSEINDKVFIEAVTYTVEQINNKLEATQFRLPDQKTLKYLFKKYYGDKSELNTTAMTEETFVEILQQVMFKGGVTNFGIKEIIFYICGIPAATWWIKNKVASQVISDEIFIPGVTMASVVLLSKRDKI